MWIVTYSKKAGKQYNDLPPAIQDRLDLLTAELELLGPFRHNWKNYSKLEGDPAVPLPYQKGHADLCCRVGSGR